MDIPTWLVSLTSASFMNEPFPLRELLKDSLYYPSSGFDGRPIQHLAGNFLSFIYVDYGYSHGEFMIELNKGFRGYDLLAERAVTEQELTPHGWHPMPPTYGDGNPSKYRDKGWIKEPFCSWSVFQLREGFSDNHGPSRFSLLYLCADGVAAFQALYVANSAAPKAVAVIQPGHGFGFNWTDFTDPNRIFARSVLGNPSGQPEFLLYGGYGDYPDACWPDYGMRVCYFDRLLTGRSTIGIWSKTHHRAKF